MKKRKLPAVTLKEAGKYVLYLLALVLLNFALPQGEPLSFALFYASILNGFHPVFSVAGFLLSSLTALSARVTLSYLIQAAVLLLLTLLYQKKERKMGAERVLYLAVLQLPFLFLVPHNGYEIFPLPVIWQKVLFCFFFLLAALFFEGGLHALLYSAFQCRLSVIQLTELSLMWLFCGLGLANVSVTAFSAVTALALLLAVLLLKNAGAIPFALVLSLPLAVLKGSLLPVAEYTLLSALALLVSSYGKGASSLAYFTAFALLAFFHGTFRLPATELIFTLLSGALPALIVAVLPERSYTYLKNVLLFYRESPLPRIAVNRARRAVGERLYEVSALFREIEGAFTVNEEKKDYTGQLTDCLKKTLCKNCQKRSKCARTDVYDNMRKLVAVGYAKGQVSLIDLSSDLSEQCANTAGMLFACNRLLSDCRNRLRETEIARESSRLLARQAHGISEILKSLALEQSEEYTFSEGESALSRALASNGILSSELFLYGEGSRLTVSMTLKQGVSGKKLSAVASRALGVPLTLAEKIPLTPTRSCYILKRKPEYDASFGIATQKKAGENASGDAYSVLKIDERRFLVALSDGMGSGEEARDVSDKTLNLLESFYKAKMPSDTVLDTVNRLITYSAEEMFTCLDLASVDLDTGETDIVKIGSPVGFILSGEELRVLEGNSLPMGALETVHPATMRTQMGENDFMLFMSDGVTSAFGSSSELYSYLSELQPINPQSLAEEILKRALTRYNGRAEDDMTVLAVKLLKSA